MPLGAAIIAGAAVYDLCKEDSVDEKKCEEQLTRDNEMCDAIARAEKLGKRPKGSAARCRATAMQRYGNCLHGIPQGDRGPLDTWNN